MDSEYDQDLLKDIQRFYEDSIPKMEDELWDMKNAAAGLRWEDIIK